MKPLDDMLPEENEPQYKELITLIQHASPRFAPVPLERQQQILARVRERLLKSDLETAPSEDMPMQVLGAISPAPSKPKALARRHHPNALVAALLMIVLFGTTLLFLRSGLSTRGGSSTGALSLQVTPSTVPLNGTITLHGSHFNPNAHVGLMRDSAIAIVDTSGNNIIRADSSGSFSDTMFVDAFYWELGAHTIYAEDALSHKSASFPIMVVGHGASPRPPHLALSQTTLDLGSGDQATNSTANLTLADSGGGVISWQSATTQPWLVLSPQSGTLSGDKSMQVLVAVDRSTLSPGSYTGQIIITSTAGKATVSVKMVVIPLAAGNEAVVQVSPAALSFTATDGEANPPTQNVTLSDPGVQPLPWHTSASTKDGGNWLTVSPRSGTVAPQGGSQSVKIGVNISTLLPGVYSGWVIFSNAGTQQVQHSPQRVFVSLTVQTKSIPATFTVSPACAIAAAPVALTFAGLVGGTDPTTKPATINASGACGNSLNWSAAVATTSGGSWLTASPAAGSVSVSASSTTQVGVSLHGLGAGTYTGTVTISATDSVTNKPVGTPQVILITLNMTTPPVLSVSPTSLTFNVTTGTSSQAITIGNGGGQPLNWSAALASGAPSFVSLSASSGTNLAGGTSTSTKVVVNATGVTGDQTFSTSVTISAVNPATGQPAAGSPATVSITIMVVPSAMQVTPTNLSFTATQGGTNTPSQAITVTNTGSDGLNWTVGAPSAGWLTAAPRSGSDNSGQKSSIELSVDISNLSPGTYSATATITPLSGGSPVTVNIALIVNPGSTPTPLPTPNVTPPGSTSLLLQAHRRV